MHRVDITHADVLDKTYRQIDKGIGFRVSGFGFRVEGIDGDRHRQTVEPHKNGLVTLAPFLLHERKVFCERFWPFQKARTCSMNSFISVSLKILLNL